MPVCNSELRTENRGWIFCFKNQFPSSPRFELFPHEGGRENYIKAVIIWFLSSQGGERLNKGRDYLIFFLTSRYYWILSSQAGFAYIELTEKSVIILRLHNQSWIISSIYQILNYFLNLSSNRLLETLPASLRVNWGNNSKSGYVMTLFSVNSMYAKPACEERIQ